MIILAFAGSFCLFTLILEKSSKNKLCWPYSFVTLPKFSCQKLLRFRRFLNFSLTTQIVTRYRARWRLVFYNFAWSFYLFTLILEKSLLSKLCWPKHFAWTHQFSCKKLFWFKRYLNFFSTTQVATRYGARILTIGVLLF